MIKTDLKTLKSFQDMWLIKWSLSSLVITPRQHERGICGGRRPGESQCGSPCGSEVSCPNSNANTHISRLQSWPKGFRIRIFAQRRFPPHPLNMTCVPQQCGKANCELYPKTTKWFKLLFGYGLDCRSQTDRDVQQAQQLNAQNFSFHGLTAGLCFVKVYFSRLSVWIILSIDSLLSFFAFACHAFVCPLNTFSTAAFKTKRFHCVMSPFPSTSIG